MTIYNAIRFWHREISSKDHREIEKDCKDESTNEHDITGSSVTY